MQRNTVDDPQDWRGAEAQGFGPGSVSRPRGSPAPSSSHHSGSTPISNKISNSNSTTANTPSGSCSSRAAQVVSRILQPLIPQGQAVALQQPGAHTAGSHIHASVTAPLSSQGPGPGPLRAVPTLRALCLGFLGRHVEDVVGQLGAHVALLPSDVKACLLCVARRRGVLTNRVLLALVDEGSTLLDLSPPPQQQQQQQQQQPPGCPGPLGPAPGREQGPSPVRLTERAIRQALLHAPALRCLDLRGLPAPACLTASTLRLLPSACPRLELLAVGGHKGQEEALLEVLPEILPHVRVPERPEEEPQFDSWEEAAECVQQGETLPGGGEPRGLQRLAVLVWPAAPPLARHVLRAVSPRVELAGELPALLPPPPSPVPHQQQLNTHQAQHHQGQQHEQQGQQPQRSVQQGCQGGSVGATWREGGAGRQGPGHGAGGRAESGGGGAGGEQQGRGRYTAPHLRRQQQAEEGRQEEAVPLAPMVRVRQHQQHGDQAPAQAHPQLDVHAVPAAPDPLLPSAGTPPRAMYPFLPLPTRVRPPPEAAPPLRPQLDDCLAVQVAGTAWGEGEEGEGRQRGRGQGGGVQGELHIAERFRLAYVEQDARLRAKAAREEEAEQRRELRGSGAARALAQWLDAE